MEEGLRTWGRTSRERVVVVGVGVGVGVVVGVFVGVFVGVGGGVGNLFGDDSDEYAEATHQ